MVRARFKPVTPDQRLRDLRKEFKGFEKEEPGPDRAARLAVFARAAHDDRQLNMAMHTAQLCLDEDPDPPALLVDAYRTSSATDEDRLRSYTDLQDLARYIDRPDLGDLAERSLHDEARDWVLTGGDQERRHRLRTLSSMISRRFADGLRDELGGTH
ncbi:MAG: hypothetical protein WD010_03690 [Nitriliruptor sp.]|uniref:hypothetical protein n=1 Tax=Nitriliruptor sp. TaxID=2448056 RepID=UPI0034A05542